MTRTGRGRKWLLLSGAALVVVAGGAALAARVLVDPEALRQQAIVAVRHQTGRTLRLGAIDVRIMPYPSVSIRDFGLSDMAGGARAEMLTAAGLDARVALLPLLHHEIRLEDVRLTRPDLLVERTADGRANWQMTPEPDDRPSGPAGSSSSTRWRVRIGSVRVQDAVLAWDDRQGHATGKAALDHVVLDGLTGGAPSFDVLGHRAGDGGASFTLAGHVGALASIQAGGQAGGAWPVHLAAAALADGRTTGSLTVEGTLADPARLRGYDVAVQAAVGRLADLDRLFPHAALPDIRDIALAAQVADMASGDGPSVPGLRMLRLRTGPADARQLAAGLRLAHLAVDAPTPADHIAVQADGALGERAFKLHGTLGTLSETLGAWRSRMATGMPVDIVLDADGGTAQLGGSLGGGQSALDIHATADHLALPGDQVLDRLTADAHVAMQGGETVQMSGLRLDAAQLALSGEAQWTKHGGTGGVPLLSGRLHADRLDFDALRGAPHPTPAPAVPAGPAAPAPPSDTMPAATAPDDAILPFERLRRLDADLDLSAAQVRLGGENYRDALAHVVLQGGRLVIDPLRAEGTDRHLNGRLSIDASGDVPRLSATLGSLVLPAEWAAPRVGIPQILRGPVQLVGTLEAQGRTRGGLRASLAGHLGLSLVNGAIDGAALGRLVGPAAAGDGASAGLRCLGVHMALGGGRAALDTIGLQTYRLSVTGHGTVGLAGQELDLHLLPQLLIGSTGAAMPVAVGGTLQAPHPRLDPAGPGGRFSLTLGPSAGIADPCPAALQAAREGQPGPAPGAAPKVRAPKALDFLRGLGILR
ncbi:lipopolysaccharide biogenesis periplasmic protein AsmA [Gluconacetobacter johannae DSM 13595]|uniref:AsmA family protein n=1 Tax=Gluconacetobacter johannae TaxID=112140 RepID=A0A7W4J438_9PROT|nr:AsmA family protein [Gluconacetobacter johannae]MBB2174348.1 AsmA family protein [Gluconacetobacter johannae]GBQ85203.1 lipopolysaccharide biogenesis periplasmic protein AsmA [Gluconacetobacter johannae DSM 13595]